MEEKELIKSCIEGNKNSLEKLINSIQPLVFNLALRFLWNRMDAEDASQEVLIKIITNLSKYDGRSKFSTWTYRVTVNHLLNLKKTVLEEKLTSSFHTFSSELKTSNDPIDYDLPDRNLLELEIKIGCTMAMMQCLDRDLRIAFILGSVLKIKSNVASTILNITPDNFRKRVELSRKLIGEFLEINCGVYNPYNSCKCNNKIKSGISCGRINKNNLNFADKMEGYVNEMNEIESITGIYQNHGTFKSNIDFVAQLNNIIATKAIINDN